MRYLAVCLFLLLNLTSFADIYQLPSITAVANPPYQYLQAASFGNQIIISESQIARSGASNIGQLLNNVAGVQYISGMAAEPQILIHAEPALIMVDGTPLNNFSMSSPDVNLIPISEIEKIEITPGVVGAIFGNQSLGGLVNIILKSGHASEKNIVFSMQNPDAEQISIGLRGSSYSANFQHNDEEGYREHNQNSADYAGLILHHYAQDSLVEITLNAMHDNLNLPGYLTDVQTDNNRTASFADQGQGTYMANTGLLHVKWQKTLNNRWQTFTQFSYRAQNADSNLDGFFNQHYNTAILNPEFAGESQFLNRTVTTQCGVELTNETYAFTSPTLYSNIIDARQQQYNFYGNITMPLVNNISISGSGRLVWVNTYGQFFNNNTGEFNPPSSQNQNFQLLTIGLSDQLSRAASVYLRRAMGYQLPFIDQSNFTAYPNTGFGLQATTSTAYETGLNWQRDALTFNIEAFLINLENEIGYYVPDNGMAANYNLAPTRREGVSLDGSYQFNPQWILGISGTVMDNRFREGPFSGKEIPGASPFLGNMNLHYQINSIWSWYGESLYTGPLYAQGDNANLSHPIPGFIIFNAAVNASFTAWLWSLRLDNITNTPYNLASIYDQYILAPHNNEVAYYPAPLRSIILSVNYKIH